MRLAFLLLLATCGLAEAQPVGKPIEPGLRVRVSILVPAGIDSTGFHSRDRLTGSLVRHDATSITVKEKTAPWAAVSKLELSAGRHGNGGSGAVIGALVGLVAGTVIGITIGRDESNDGDDLETEMGIALGLGGMLAGAGIGAIVGGAHKSDDWIELLLANETRSAPADSSR